MVKSRNWPELLLGFGIIIVGLVIAKEAAFIRVAPLYAKVGPAAFMWFSAALLGFCGIVVAWKAFGAPSQPHHELRGPLTILAALGLSPLVLQPLGFIPTSTLIFALTANGLGSRNWKRDVFIGLILSSIAFVVFGKLLGLRLPVGMLFS